MAFDFQFQKRKSKLGMIQSIFKCEHVQDEINSKFSFHFCADFRLQNPACNELLQFSAESRIFKNLNQNSAPNES